MLLDASEFIDLCHARIEANCRCLCYVLKFIPENGSRPGEQHNKTIYQSEEDTIDSQLFSNTRPLRDTS